MAYDSEVVLQVAAVSKGLNEAIDGIVKLGQAGVLTEKQTDALTRTLARADKNFATTAESAGKAATAEKGMGDAADRAAAGMSKMDAAAKLAKTSAGQVASAVDGATASLARFQRMSDLNTPLTRLSQTAAGVQQNRLYADYMAAQSEYTAGAAAASKLGNFKSSTIAADSNSIDQSKAQIDAARTTAALRAEVAQYGQLAVAERLAADASANLAAQQAKVDALVSKGAPLSLQAEEYRALAASVNADAAAQERLAAAQKAAAGASAGQSLSTTRTSLYDASRALTSFSIGLLALPVISAVVASAYQRDFASVTRTLVGQKYNADSLKQSFLDLSEEIPISFKQITDIASAGAQLGLKAKDLTPFTKVVAELTSTTNLSADAAENFLGKFHAIADLKPSQFTQLGSALLNVGVNTAATEQQIATAATGIVGIGKEAGFTIPQIVGLAGAFTSVSSSIRNPQLIRGTMTRFVNDMSNAVRDGGPALDAYAKTAGLTGKAVQDAFGTDKFAGTFQKFIDGLDGVQKSGGDTVGVLNAIGIHSVQDIPLLLNLANGHKTLADSMKAANEGWNNQIILQEHFDKINDTLASKVRELGNSFGVLFNDIGSVSTGPLTSLVEGLQGVVKWIDSLTKSSSGQVFLELSAGLLAFGGAITLGLAIISKLVAGVIATGQAYRGVTKFISAHTAAQATDNAVVAEGAAKNDLLGASMVRAGAQAKEASIGVRIFGDALKAASIIGLVWLAADFAAPFANQVAQWARSAEGLTNSTGQVQKAAESGAAALNKLKEFSSQGNMQGQGALGGWTNALSGGTKSGLAGFADQLKEVNDSWLHLDFGGAEDKAQQLDKAFASLVKSGNSKTAASEFAAISKEWTSQGGNLDDLIAKFPKYADAMKSAKSAADTFSTSADKQDKSLSELNTQFQTLSGMNSKEFGKYSDSIVKSIGPLTDFNSIVGQVQASLQSAAQAQADAAGGSAKAKDYYDGTSVSLQQMTDQYTQNAQIASQWLSGIQTVATTYGTQVANQFIAAGYSVTNNSILQQLINATPDQAAAYIKAMTDAANSAAQAMGVALITAGSLVTQSGGQVGADTATKMGQMLQAGFSPADIMQALNLKFADPANAAKPKAKTDDAQKVIDDFIAHNRGWDVPGEATLDPGPAQNKIDTFIRLNNGRSLTVYVDYQGRNQGYVAPGGKLQPTGATGGYFTGSAFKYSNGGPVFGAGTGTSDSVPAWLSNGEYVIKASSVRALGTDYLNAINKYGSAALHRATGGPVSHSFSPVGRYATGGPVTVQSPDVVTVQLSPYDRQLLENAGNLTVSIPGTYIAKATSQSNALSSSRGA